MHKALAAALLPFAALSLGYHTSAGLFGFVLGVLVGAGALVLGVALFLRRQGKPPAAAPQPEPAPDAAWLGELLTCLKALSAPEVLQTEGLYTGECAAEDVKAARAALAEGRGAAGTTAPALAHALLAIVAEAPVSPLVPPNDSPLVRTLLSSADDADAAACIAALPAASRVAAGALGAHLARTAQLSALNGETVDSLAALFAGAVFGPGNNDVEALATLVARFGRLRDAFALDAREVLAVQRRLTEGARARVAALAVAAPGAAEGGESAAWATALGQRVLAEVGTSRASRERMTARLDKLLNKVDRPSFLGPISVQGLSVGGAQPEVGAVRVVEARPDGALTVAMDARLASVAFQLRSTLTVSVMSVSIGLRVTVSDCRGRLLLHLPPRHHDLGFGWVSFADDPGFEVAVDSLVGDTEVVSSAQLPQLTAFINKALHAELGRSMRLPHWDRVEMPWAVPDATAGAAAAGVAAAGGGGAEHDAAGQMLEFGLTQAGEWMGAAVGSAVAGSMGRAVASKIGGVMGTYASSTVAPVLAAGYEEMKPSLHVLGSAVQQAGTTLAGEALALGGSLALSGGGVSGSDGGGSDLPSAAPAGVSVADLLSSASSAPASAAAEEAAGAPAPAEEAADATEAEATESEQPASAGVSVADLLSSASSASAEEAADAPAPAEEAAPDATEAEATEPEQPANAGVSVADLLSSAAAKPATPHKATHEEPRKETPKAGVSIDALLAGAKRQ